LSDLQDSKREVQPKQYHKFGKKKMRMKHRGHMEQRSHPMSIG